MANIIRKNTGQMATTGTEWDPFRMMRDMLRWDPFREIMPRFPTFEEKGVAFMPDFEVKETKDAYVFKADLPGVEDKDLEVTLNANRLTVSGKREAEAREEGDTWYAYERTFGNFSRSFTLPEDVNSDDVRADLKNGVLTVAVPKKPERQPKKIEVKGEKTEGKTIKA
jgi:HSP20 family protein